MRIPDCCLVWLSTVYPQTGGPMVTSGADYGGILVLGRITNLAITILMAVQET